MTERSTCPVCSKPIPANAPGGLCPDCLLGRGIIEPQKSHRSAAFAVTTPQGKAPAVPAPEELARYFPQFEILELIGHGGMGAVYKARQPKLDRVVAIKIIRPGVSDDPAFAERFMREARTLARLSHPHIVGIHDFGEIEETAGTGNSPSSGSVLFYFVMEYVDGVNLRQLMSEERLSSELALNIIPQICDALQFAHDEGVVHRDIKPENILIDSRGRVRIADFGLAKLVHSHDENFTLTGTHQVMGTPRYMAPEQMTGTREVDHRADIYSLGVVFYEMLTGDIPAGHFAPPSQKSGSDVRLDSVVLRAMSREPERRFQSAKEFRSSVDLVSAAGGVSVTPPAMQAGLSTIIDREVAGAWHLLAGTSAVTGQGRRDIPWMLVTLLSLLICMSIALPWFIVEPAAMATVANTAEPIEQRVASAGEFVFCVQEGGADRSQFVVRRGGRLSLAGHELWCGRAAAVLFGFVALTAIVLPARWRSRLASVGLLTVASAGGLLLQIAAIQEARRLPIEIVSSDEERSAAEPSYERLAARTLSSGEYITCVQELPESWFSFSPGQTSSSSNRVGAGPAWYVSLVFASGVLVLMIAATRNALVAWNDPAPATTAAVDRSDAVSVDLSVATSGQLPDICMISGVPTTTRQTIKVSHQPQWATAASLVGFVCGGIPGVVIMLLTEREVLITVPVSREHRNHWFRLRLVASIGWMLPAILVGVGVVVAPDWHGEPGVNRFLGALAYGGAGLIVYLIPVIYLACTVAKVELVDDRLTFSRVSSAFANAVRARSKK